MWDWETDRVHFNLSCGIWRGNDAFPQLSPDVSSPAALFPWPYAGGPGIPLNLTGIALPARTDVRDSVNAGGFIDFIECPIGSGRFYSVQWWEDVRKGHPGEYRVAVCQKSANPNTSTGWPDPTP